jgi:hypothetical protein
MPCVEQAEGAGQQAARVAGQRSAAGQHAQQLPRHHAAFGRDLGGEVPHARARHRERGLSARGIGAVAQGGGERGELLAHGSDPAFGAG